MHNEHSADATANPWADQINEAYYDGMGSAFGARTRDRINWMCSQVIGDSVLDIGCSQGIASILLAREGLQVTGIDIDQPTIDYAVAERAKEIASVQERIEFRCMDLAALPPGTFDTVIMGEVIEHQTSPGRFLARAATFLAPGGRLVVTVPFGLNPWPDHKSTIFPSDLALALPGDFIVRDLSANDGYIRMVADRDVAAGQSDWSLMLGATRIGALDVHRKYYEISDELQRLRKQKAVLESSIKTMQSSLEGETKEKNRLELEWRHEQKRLESARAELGSTEAKLESTKAELESTKAELESTKTEFGSTKVELGGAKAEFGSASAELERLRRELRQVSEQESQYAAQLAQKATDEKAAIEAELDTLRSEFAVAQAKRNGHFLHLEAERAYGYVLQERLRELHEENYRFQHSLALAIGRAILKLRTLRGMIGFPRAMVRALLMYRNRGNSIPLLQLPARPAVRSLSSVAPITALVTTTAGEQARKELSVAGWSQQLEAGKVVAMSVMDEFSRECFAPHINLIEPRPDNWEGLLDRYLPQFLFVESSWRGNSGAWQYRVANYANPPGNEIVEMVTEFKRRGVPTVFWNKEDPVHFNDFIGKAIHFDHVFTTAEEALPNYTGRTTANVGVLQFAAEEALHNPVGSSERNGKVCFAGSFYANRFPERRDDQLMLLDAARAYDFDIFDRNHKPDVAASDFSFPERFAGNIRGSLPYSEVNAAYRRYRVFLNVNSVVDSPTMFSRRVFELLACGTPVISTWSQGTESTFGNDLVWHVRSAEEAEEALSVLMKDDREWTRRSLHGIREVFGKHTYRHRFAQICAAIGLEQPVVERFTKILVVAEVESSLAANLVMDAFHRQVLLSGSSKRLLLVCRGRFELEGLTDSGVNEVQVIRSELSIGEVVANMGAEASHAVIAVMSTRAVYGKFHLQDMINALRYSGAQMIGKSSDARLQYSYDADLDPASLLIDGDRVATDSLTRILDGRESFVAGGRARFAADQANFLSVAEGLDLARVRDEIPKIEI
ncbi:methyltransferase domain-containing protein [Stenotrophomonas sp. Iso1]|uniref:glycosyltransferase family protein n=1 Tax=Stenotrophomonas sp. Iso1 TaxID=2977283 RepID=UPI0022B7938E|nr:methyltransferase domain-containing protein [Stenotrophomonas sp. Iso1]